MNFTKSINLLRCSLAAILLTASSSAGAIIYKYDNLNTSKGTCRLAGWSGSQPSSGKLTIPSSYEDENGNTYTVNSIAPHALDNLTTVKQIKIPATIIRIGNANFKNGTSKSSEGERALNFFNCPALEKFEVDSKNNVFEASDDGMLYAKGLTQLLRVPEHIAATDGALSVTAATTAISEDAFRGNTTITHLTLPVNARIYGNGGLNRASSIASYSLSGTGNRLKVGFEILYCKDSEDASYEMVSFPPASPTTEAGAVGVTVVRDEAFFGCLNLKTIHLHDTQTLGVRALSQTGIKEQFFPRSVICLGEGVLEKNANLESIRSSMDAFQWPVLPEHFASDCPNLTEYTGIGKIYDLSTAAFKNCPKLTVFPFPGTIRLSGDSIFFNTGFEKIQFTPGTAQDYTPGRAIFGNCRNLKEIDASIIGNTNDNPFPLGPDYASGCLKLRTLRLPQFARIVRNAITDNPPFGYSCTIDTIQSHTIYGLEDYPSFNYSPVNGVMNYRPTAMLALTGGWHWEQEEWNCWPAGKAFSAGNGASVAPTIFIDSYNPPADYVCKNATYYVGAMCRDNYKEALETGCEVNELFKLTLEFPKKGNMKYQVDTIPGLPYQIETFTIHTNHNGNHLGDFGKLYTIAGEESEITNLTVLYRVNGYSFETDYGDPHDLPAATTGVNVISEASEDDWIEVYTLSGLLIERKKGLSSDFSSLSSGLYILRIKDRKGIRTEKVNILH